MSNFFPPPPQPRQDPMKVFHDRVQRLEEQVAGLFNQVQSTTKRLYAMEAMEALREQGRKPRRRIEFRSQNGEDLVMWDLSDRATTGFYIEVGAFDGYSLSTTYALDAMGWNGLLIEPILARYEQCKARRPDARVVHAALGAPGSPPTTTFMVTEDQYGGMLSHMGTDTRHAKTVEWATKKSVTVPLTTMNELLKDHQGEIDVASIDVEGSEVVLLQGFDLLKYRPKLILLEDYPDDQASPLPQYMAKQPYTQLGWMESNRIYARNDLVEEFSKRM